MDSARGKVRVLIATTAGPVEVLRLTEEDAAIGRSVVCIDGTTEIASISRDYQAFVASPTGIIERLYGHSCYRLDVSKPIDNGSSWQLGAFAAHALHAADRLAQEGEPCDTVLLVSGAVRIVDLKVRDVTHASRKIEQALDRLRAEVTAGKRAVIVIPAGNANEMCGSFRGVFLTAGAELVGVGSLAELAGALGLRIPDTDNARAQEANLPVAVGWRSSRMRPGFAATGILLGISALVAAPATYILAWRGSAGPAVAISTAYDGHWTISGVGGKDCPLKQWTRKLMVVGGLIPASHPEKGFVRATGEFRFTRPALTDRTMIVEFLGKFVDAGGEGTYHTFGHPCSGTFDLKRVQSD